MDVLWRWLWKCIGCTSIIESQSNYIVKQWDLWWLLVVDRVQTEAGSWGTAGSHLWAGNTLRSSLMTSHRFLILLTPNLSQQFPGEFPLLLSSSKAQWDISASAGLHWGPSPQRTPIGQAHNVPGALLCMFVTTLSHVHWGSLHWLTHSVRSFRAGNTVFHFLRNLTLNSEAYK